jgi:hypothetical protein
MDTLNKVQQAFLLSRSPGFCSEDTATVILEVVTTVVIIPASSTPVRYDEPDAEDHLHMRTLRKRSIQFQEQTADAMQYSIGFAQM